MFTRASGHSQRLERGICPVLLMLRTSGSCDAGNNPCCRSCVRASSGCPRRRRCQRGSSPKSLVVAGLGFRVLPALVPTHCIGRQASGRAVLRRSPVECSHWLVTWAGGGRGFVWCVAGLGRCSINKGFHSGLTRDVRWAMDWGARFLSIPIIIRVPFSLLFGFITGTLK